MKEKILSIASDLREGFITSNEAKELLLVLFGVSKSACNNFYSDPFVNEYKCLNCGKMKSEH
jgi:regulator of replication initiation timing